MCWSGTVGKKKKKGWAGVQNHVRGTRLVPCIYSEAPQTSLPLKALPYWHFFQHCTLLKARGNNIFLFLSSFSFFCPSVRTIRDCSFPFLSHWFQYLPPNRKKAAFKRQTVTKQNKTTTLNGLQTLYLKNGSELEVSKWSLPSKKKKKKKIFYWGSERDLEQSTVYVTYLIQESRSLDKPCFRTSQIHWKKKKCSKQPTKLLYWFSFILYGDKD